MEVARPRAAGRRRVGALAPDSVPTRQWPPSLTVLFRVAQVSAARKFLLRQGLWIEDLQTPPGQECSNGSMILLAVVLWRAFLVRRALPHETSQNQNSAFLP